MKGLFVTGTDTGVGKTFVAANLCRQWVSQGFDLAIRKPVESGCAIKNGQQFPQDAFCLQQAARSQESLDQICPFRYSAPLSPAHAAKLENKPLKLDQLVKACHVDPSKLLLVEGAGGFYSPISQDGLNADLAVKLGLPVLIVAENRLGAINQVLLVLEAVQQRGLNPMGVVLNQLQPNANPLLQNRLELQTWTQRPILEIPYLSQENIHQANRLFGPALKWFD